MSQFNVDVSFKAIEPGIINEEVIRKTLDEQGPKGEAGRLLTHDGIILEEVKSIRLEFLNILAIDHLWMMTSLVKLDLSNNVIEKIENIETLINLKELSLSFNNIEKIENLDTLINLEILTLFENHILKVENLDELEKLTILSLGNNKISHWNDMIYLRNFKSLRSLNMAGNPCCSENPDGDSKRNQSQSDENEIENREEVDFGDGANTDPKLRKDEFRIYTIAMLPQLRYYEYFLINEEEREVGKEKYRHQLLHLVEEEEKLSLALNQKKAKEELLSKEKAAWVDSLFGTQLFDEMINSDTYGEALIKLDEDIQEIYDEFRAQFVEVTSKLYSTGLEKKKERDEEERQFVECLKKAKEITRKQSESIMTELFKEKIRCFAKITRLIQHMEEVPASNPKTEDGTRRHREALLEVSTLGEEEELGGEEASEQIQMLGLDFHDMCQKTWDRLMLFETQLYEQIEETLATFERNISDQVTALIETAQVHFVSLRDLETQCFERAGVAVPRYFAATRVRIAAYQAKIAMQGENSESQTSIKDQEEEEKESCPKVPKILEQCLENKDALQNALISSHDVHLQVIDAREDKLFGEAKKWLKDKLDEHTRNEVKGNRERLHEIISVINLFKEEFEELQASSVTLPMLADLEIMEG